MQGINSIFVSLLGYTLFFFQVSQRGAYPALLKIDFFAEALQAPITNFHFKFYWSIFSKFK